MLFYIALLIITIFFIRKGRLPWSVFFSFFKFFNLWFAKYLLQAQVVYYLHSELCSRVCSYNIRVNTMWPRLISHSQGNPLYHNTATGTIISNQSLVLQSVTRSRAGIYTCIGNNQEGDGESNPLNLDIKCEYLLHEHTQFPAFPAIRHYLHWRSN